MLRCLNSLSFSYLFILTNYFRILYLPQGEKNHLLCGFRQTFNINAFLICSFVFCFLRPASKQQIFCTKNLSRVSLCWFWLYAETSCTWLNNWKCQIRVMFLNYFVQFAILNRKAPSVIGGNHELDVKGSRC